MTAYTVALYIPDEGEYLVIGAIPDGGDVEKMIREAEAEIGTKFDEDNIAISTGLELVDEVRFTDNVICTGPLVDENGTMWRCAVKRNAYQPATGFWENGEL